MYPPRLSGDERAQAAKPAEATRGMCSDPGQVHPPRPVLDEEQHVQAAQEHGIDVEEVRRQDRLGIQERPPGLPGPPGCRVDADVLEDLPHRRWRELVSQADHVLQAREIAG